MLAIVAIGLLATGAWWVTGAVVNSGPTRRPAPDFFGDNKDDLERVLALVQNGELIADGYYGPTLPQDLQHLSVTDRVSIYNDGSFFVPRWTGIPDDAGGIWWSQMSPEFRDMYGMACIEPVDLNGDWWLCG